MRTIVVILCALGCLLLFGAFVLIKEDGPEKLIIGEWQEVAWQYEKLDHDKNIATSWISEIDEHQRQEISESMIIHEAEVWSFDSNGHVKLYNKDGKNEHVNYIMKGRGNILKLEHYNNALEYFEIQELTSDSLVLHFSFDLQVRGIVKLTFKRI